MKEKNSTPIKIPAMEIHTANIRIVGDTSLIVHKFSEKTKREMLEKQMKVATTKSSHEIKNPVADFMQSLYWITPMPEDFTEASFDNAIENGARFGFPSIAIKQAACSAAYRNKITKDKVSIYGAFHIVGELVEIQGTPTMREDMVRIQGTSADIRYRGEFVDWSAEFTVRFNPEVYTLAQIINFINMGGFSCGIGEWRPEKAGMNGMYHCE